MVVEIPASKMYPSGGVFVKYSADGGSFAYYPSGRMAMAYERMGGGFYAYFYVRVGTSFPPCLQLPSLEAMICRKNLR